MKLLSLLLGAMASGLLVGLICLVVFCIVGFVTGVWLPGPALVFSGWIAFIGACAHVAGEA